MSLKQPNSCSEVIMRHKQMGKLATLTLLVAVFLVIISQIAFANFGNIITLLGNSSSASRSGWLLVIETTSGGEYSVRCEPDTEASTHRRAVVMIHPKPSAIFIVAPYVLQMDTSVMIANDYGHPLTPQEQVDVRRAVLGYLTNGTINVSRRWLEEFNSSSGRSSRLFWPGIAINAISFAIFLMLIYLCARLMLFERMSRRCYLHLSGLDSVCPRCQYNCLNANVCPECGFKIVCP